MRDDRTVDSDEEPETMPAEHDESPITDDPALTADGCDDAVSSANPYHSPPEQPSVLETITARLRTDPGLWLPFFIAGCLLVAVDFLRERDSIPVVSGISESTIQISYSIYPTGTTVTDRPLGALVDLQRPLLGYALGLEIFAVAVIAIAGWLTMARASDQSFQAKRVLVYVGGVFLTNLLFRVVETGNFEYTGGSLLVGLTILGLVIIVFVRLFLVPITVLHEGGILAPISASWRYSRQRGLMLAGMIILIGAGSWTLARVPVGGTILSTTIAGTVHAVSLVVLYEYCAIE